MSKAKYINELLEKKGSYWYKTIHYTCQYKFNSIKIWWRSPFWDWSYLIQVCYRWHTIFHTHRTRLTSFANSCILPHWVATKRLLRYLKGSIQFRVMLHKTQILSLSLCIDENLASNTNDRRSIGGHCIYMEDSLISQYSSKHKVVSKSSTKIEFKALAYGITELLWFKCLLTELHLKNLVQPIF